MDDSWLVTEAVSSSSPLLSFLLSFLPFSPVILKATKQTNKKENSDNPKRRGRKKKGGHRQEAQNIKEGERQREMYVTN